VPLPPLALAKRLFHILGIDILLDSEMNREVPELKLKESVIADAFEH
jgi:hypothetical protein